MPVDSAAARISGWRRSTDIRGPLHQAERHKRKNQDAAGSSFGDAKYNEPPQLEPRKQTGQFHEYQPSNAASWCACTIDSERSALSFMAKCAAFPLKYAGSDRSAMTMKMTRLACLSSLLFTNRATRKQSEADRVAYGRKMIQQKVEVFRIQRIKH